MTFGTSLLVACCIAIIFIAQMMRSFRTRRERQMRGDP